MMKFVRYLVVAVVLVGCQSVKFSGGGGSRSSTPPPPANEDPNPPAGNPGEDPKAPTPDPNPTPLPPECQNTVSTTGVKDSAGRTFKLLPNKLSYPDAVNSCKQTGANGKLIYASQELPESVLACQKALGTLWLRRSADAALWQPPVEGERDPSELYWVICFF